MLTWDFLPGPGEGAVPICSEAWEGQSPVTQVCDRPPPARRVREMRPTEAIPGFVEGAAQESPWGENQPLPFSGEGPGEPPPRSSPLSWLGSALRQACPRELREEERYKYFLVLFNISCLFVDWMSAQ